MKKIHFKGLNELRALAALAVVFYHIELYKKRAGTISLFNTFLKKSIESLGHNGVNLFFVLSGFLITYLLIEEKEKFGKIDIKKFYIRRLLRIWPLYYFIFLVAIFILPFAVKNLGLFNDGGFYAKYILMVDVNFETLFLLFLLFLPNLALAKQLTLPGASQAWSVGTEEQYYLFWPIVIDKIKKDFWVVFFIAFIIAKSALNMIAENNFSPETSSFIYTLKVELMAIGAIGAYYTYYHNEKIIPWTTNKWLFILNTILILICLKYQVHHLIFGVLFLYLILYSINDSPLSLRNKYLDEVGKISYGVYMYHPIIMFITYSLINNFIEKNNLIIYNILVYFFTIAGSFVISKLSYNYFESYFLKLKSKGYTVVESGS
ncbi:acyltransferase family protein [Flexibacter flexilis]|nr:acyltransferase [Flexibacter flexilis]